MNWTVARIILLATMVIAVPVQGVLAASPQSVKFELQQAMSLQAAGNLAGAEQVARQALADAATLGGKRNFSIAVAQEFLGGILRDEGKFAEAESMLRQSLATTEGIYGVGHFSTISTLGSLGALYLRQGRYEEAEGAFEQASHIAVGKYGENSFEAAEMLNSLASAQASLGKGQEAAVTFQRVLAIAKRGGAQSLDLAAGAANNLGIVLQQAGRNDEALAAYHDAYNSNVAMFGPDSPAAMLNLANAGIVLRDMGNLPEAERMLSTVLAFRERVLGDDHPETAQLQNDMGWLELAKNAPQDALPYFQKSVAAYQRLHSLQTHGIRAQGAGIAEREVGRSILGFLRSLSQLQAQNPANAAALLDQGFQAAQGLHTSAAADSLARAGARLASGGGALGDVVRQGQDLAGQWQYIDAALTKALASPANQRNPAFEQQARAQLDAVGAKIDAIDTDVAQRFPGYSSLTHPQPLSVSDVQGLLDPDEALVLISAFGGNNGNGTFVWVVTKTDAKAVSSDTSIAALSDMLWTLRCGVDIDASSTDAGSADCKSRGVETLPNGLPKFSAKAAYDLYHALFGGLEETIAGKSLLIVAPDPLAAIPFQILASKPPAQDFPQTQSELRAVAWLGRDSAISVLPSVTALRIMRGQVTRDHAPDLYVGFGDPVLNTGRGCPEVEASTTCPAPTGSLPQQTAMVKRSVTDISKLFKNGGVDVDAVRSLCALPDTATELKCVASSIGADPASVHIGADATLTTLRRLDLEKFRIIHFATHGLVAGELAAADGTPVEPALVLTPPDMATPDDNGLLKESDIVNLKLNADWVILSACNTAAGQQSGGEALSGLASAFLYAGARALLASHWSVSSDAAVRLTTGAMMELSKDPTVGRAEAMRRAMVQILDHGGETDAHPLIWAPFSVIGEGGKGHS